MSTKSLTHEAIAQALASGDPLTQDQRAVLLGLVADDKVWQRECDRLRAALAEQAQPAECGHESCDCRGYCKRTTQPAPQPLTIERLRSALVASRVVPPEAVEDADNYDDGVMLARIDALHRRLT